MPFLPTTPVLDKRTYASPMSYVGATRRTTAWAKKVGASSSVAAVVSWTVAVTWLAAMWVIVLPVYLFFTFFIFGWLMIPFRLFRRSSRKQQHLQELQLATMQQMLVQQQALQQRHL
jgi:Flp pilus assembly protein TadB